MRRIAVFLLALLLAVPEAQAVDPNPQGDLQLYVAISDTADYIDEWIRTPPDHDIHIQRIEDCKIGDTAYVAFILSGFSIDDKGGHRLAVDFVVYKPDGTVMFEETDYAKAQGKGILHPTFVMADPALDVTFEKGDQTGPYKIEGTVRDLVSGSKATAVAVLLVKDSP